MIDNISLPEVELVIAGGEAGGVDGGVRQVNQLVHGDDGKIVVQAGWAEFWVSHNGHHLVFLQPAVQGSSIVTNKKYVLLVVVQMDGVVIFLQIC